MPLFDVYPLYDVTPVRAKGVHLYGADRKKYLDLYGGHAVISIGHRPTLKQFHDSVLELRGNGDWRLMPATSYDFGRS